MLSPVPGQYPDSQQRILVVERDRRLRAALAQSLSHHGFQVDTALPGKAAVRQLASAPYDLVLLDPHQPAGAGENVLRRVHTESPMTAVIAVTGCAAFNDVVAALREGVADYLVKPVSPAEVVASIQRVESCRSKVGARRHLLDTVHRCINDLAGFALPPGPAEAAHHMLALPPLTLDCSSGVLIITGEAEVRRVELSAGEAQLLAHLMSAPGQVWSCQSLVRVLWQQEAEALGAESVVRSLIARLRARIGQLPGCPALLRTVRGRGYCLVPVDPTDSVAALQDLPTPAALPERRILIVDGSTASRRRLEHDLRRLGQSVDVAMSPDTALVQLEVGHYDLVMLDTARLHVTPGDWVRRARRLRAHLPIIVIAAPPSYHDAVAALRAQVDGYVVKPASPHVLATAISRVLSRIAARRRCAALADAIALSARTPPGA